jgi:hypothetical protein
VTDTRSSNDDAAAATPAESRWLISGAPGEPSPVAPAPIRSNRFKRPDEGQPDDPQSNLAERVERLESRLGAEIEATQRAVGGELRALDKVVESLEARVRVLERRIAAMGAADQGATKSDF